MKNNFANETTSQTDVLLTFKDYMMQSLKCNELAVVKQLNADNTVDVSPVCMLLKKDGDYLKQPLIKNVPIQFLGANGFYTTFKPVKGDFCLLSICDNDLKTWQKAGGLTSKNLNLSKHNITNAVAYFCVKPNTQKIDYLSDGIALNSNDGSIKIEINNDNVHLKYNDSEFKINNGSITEIVGGTLVKTATSSKVTFFVPVEAPTVELQTLIGKGGNATMNGALNGGDLNPDNISQGGKSLNSDHTHSNGNQGSPTGGVI